MQDNKRLKRLFLQCISVLLLVSLYFFRDARFASFLPKCPFYFITGYYCPGCGSQRAVSSLLHGDIKQALHFNLLLVGSLPLIIYSAVISVLNDFKKENVVQRVFYSTKFVTAFLLLIIVFFIIRNIPVFPFSLLAPL